MGAMCRATASYRPTDHAVTGSAYDGGVTAGGKKRTGWIGEICCATVEARYRGVNMTESGSPEPAVPGLVRKVLSFEMTIAEWIGTALLLAAPYVVIEIGRAHV